MVSPVNGNKLEIALSPERFIQEKLSTKKTRTCVKKELFRKRVLKRTRTQYQIILESRSFKAFEYFMDLRNFNGEQYLYDNTWYEMLRSTSKKFSRIPHVSLGSCEGREIILLHPEHDLEIKKYFTIFLKKIKTIEIEKQQALSNEEIFFTLNDFMRNELLSNSSYEAVEKFINEQREKGPCIEYKDMTIPCIHIDEFVKRKIGVCRHISLMTAYFLDSLKQTQSQFSSSYLSGKIRCRRDNIKIDSQKIPHAWVTFASENEKWNVDISRNVITKKSKIPT